MEPQANATTFVWIIIALIFLGLLLDYAPRIGAGVALLIILYLVLRLGQSGVLSGK